MTVEPTTCLGTLRLKVKSEAYPWLNAVAEPSQTYGRCEAGISALRLAA